MPKLAVFFVFFALVAFGEKAGVKVDDIPTQQDTSIVIKKGDVQAQSCIEYNIVEGTEEVFGEPQFERKKAYDSWKAACQEWKTQLKGLNKDNVILTMTCNRPSPEKEGDLWIFKGTARYAIKTKIKDRVK